MNKASEKEMEVEYLDRVDKEEVAGDGESRSGREIVLTYQGATRTLAEWARVLDVPRHNLYFRYRMGWPTEKILTTPFKTFPGTKQAKVKEVMAATGLSKAAVYGRLRRGWSVEEMLDPNFDPNVHTRGRVRDGELPRRIYSYLVQYKRKNDGLAPTLRQMRRALDDKPALGTIKAALVDLAREGLIKNPSGTPRDIRIVGGHWELTPPESQPKANGKTANGKQANGKSKR